MKGKSENTNKLNAVIVDDDEDARKLLSILLKKFPEIKIVGEAENISKAVALINKKKPDSVFLDIHMNEANAFDLMNKLSTDAKVIFVSADDEFALRAFEVNAFDYIKKPVEPKRLALTVARLLEQAKNKKIAENVLIQDTGQPLPNEEAKNEQAELKNEEIVPSKTQMLEYDDRLFLTIDGVSRFIKISSIEFISAEKDYSYTYLVDGKKFLVLKPMVEWEKRLTKKHFIRIHRSTIINLEYVEKIEKWFNSSYHVYLQNFEQPFQMSRRYVSKLKERFK